VPESHAVRSAWIACCVNTHIVYCSVGHTWAYSFVLHRYNCEYCEKSKDLKPKELVKLGTHFCWLDYFHEYIINMDVLVVDIKRLSLVLFLSIAVIAPTSSIVVDSGKNNVERDHALMTRTNGGATNFKVEGGRGEGGGDCIVSYCCV